MNHIKLYFELQQNYLRCLALYLEGKDIIKKLQLSLEEKFVPCDDNKEIFQKYIYCNTVLNK